jgi:SagB-type dehydrogenase family enzyme
VRPRGHAYRRVVGRRGGLPGHGHRSSYINGGVRASVARAFHDATTHTPASVRAGGHTLDWDNKPFPFKVYVDAPAVALPRDLDPVDLDTLPALAGAARRGGRLTLDGLATVLYFAAGVTKKKTYPGGGEVLFRAAASTGALYQTEVYVVAGAVDGLAPGLYHFSPGDFLLRRLREGDVRAALAGAAADADVATRAATIVPSAIYWRNTWKYRHLFWDSGTMLANLLAVGGALGLAPRCLAGFVDADVNRLLGLDVAREAALEVVPLGPATPPAPAVAVAPLALETLPLSEAEVDYPALREVHAASSLATPEDVRRWRAALAGVAVDAPARGDAVPLPAPRPRAGRGLGETIQHRGSTRRFGHAPLAADELATVLWAAARPIEGDVRADLVEVHLIVNAVAGVAEGAYRYDAAAHALVPLAGGRFRREAGYLTLEQALGADAAAVLFFLAPLDAVLTAAGDRGYRAVNLAAGLAGGRAYLAAYAQRFGASGLTFYDDEVVRFFGARGRDAIFVTALGRAAVPSEASPTLTMPRRPAR